MIRPLAFHFACAALLLGAELLSLGQARAGDWEGAIGAGVLTTDGNSQSRSVNAKINVDYRTEEHWKNSFQGSAVNTSGTTGTTAERYLASDKLDYNFTEQNYAFVVGEYEKDLFGGTRERTSEVLGLGRHVLTGPAHFLDLELGAGVRQTTANTVAREKNDENIGRASGRYEWKFTDKNAFLQTVKSEGGEDNIFTESVTALKLAVIGTLSAALSYTVRHNSEVPPDRENVDTETALNLVYDFGKD